MSLLGGSSGRGGGSTGDAEWHVQAGNTLVGQGELERALEEYTEAIQLNPSSPMGYLGRGVVYAKQVQYRQAIADYTKAIGLDPRLASAYRNRGRDLMATGAVKRAIADFTEAIRLEPDDFQAYCDRATAHNRSGRFPQAQADATEAIRLAPGFYLGYDARGWAFIGGANQGIFTFWRRGNAARRKADYQQAVVDFTEAIRLQPSALDCYYGRSQAYKALGDRENAARDAGRVPGLRR